ncbi:MAG: DUF29 domain-containing protein [Microcystaceae cyanobacterium]
MKPLYESDYGLWAETMAKLLETGQFSQLDIENLAEEVRDLSKRERDKLISSMRLILHHLLKWDYQPQKQSRSWMITIERERNNISDYLEDSPSFHRYLSEEWIKKAYRNARLNAAKETDLEFPIDCPYTIEDVLERPITLE